MIVKSTLEYQRHRKVEIVTKDGVGYDTEKLIQSVQGLAGIR